VKIYSTQKSAAWWDLVDRFHDEHKHTRVAKGCIDGCQESRDLYSRPGHWFWRMLPEQNRVFVFLTGRPHGPTRYFGMKYFRFECLLVHKRSCQFGQFIRISFSPSQPTRSGRSRRGRKHGGPQTEGRRYVLSNMQSFSYESLAPITGCLQGMRGVDAASMSSTT